MSDREARRRLQVGGQAVIEGVMMRSPECIATAVRTPSGGIVVEREPFKSLTRRYRILNIPIVRGAVAFVETFVIAIRALSFSAEKATADPAAQAAEDAAGSGPKKRSAALSSFQVFIMIVVAFGLGFLIFFYVPLVITELTGLTQGVLFNLVDGIIRLAFLILYIVIITRWKEMRRIFEYHGAEHKTIAAFEEEGTATLDNVRAYSTLHARCSTSFLLLVVVVSIVIFMFLGRPHTVGQKLIRFAFIPVIGGVSYELLKLSANPRVRPYMAFLVAPGLFLQKLTTKEPALDQIEVAIAALDACIADKTVES